MNKGDNTVLIVDDEELVRDVWDRFLSRQGYMVLQSETGEEALELFNQQNENIDLVILDLNMPGIGGIQCLHEMRKINPDTPVMVTSGYILEDKSISLNKLGVAGFIQKPINFSSYMEKIRQVIDRKINNCC